MHHQQHKQYKGIVDTSSTTQNNIKNAKIGTTLPRDKIGFFGHLTEQQKKRNQPKILHLDVFFQENVMNYERIFKISLKKNLTKFTKDILFFNNVL